MEMAVAEGFEPSVGGYPTHAFEACSLGRSDTPPARSLRAVRGAAQIASGAGLVAARMALPAEEIFQQ